MTEIEIKERYPNLQTIFMVEKFLEESDEYMKQAELFEKLPKKMMWNTFKKIIDYLQSINKIMIEDDGRIVYIWNPKFTEKIKNRPNIEI